MNAIPDLTTQKQQIFDYVNAFLGGGMVDVELDPIHYETALTKSLTKYRQRSENSVEESTGTIVTQAIALDDETQELSEVQTCVCPSIKTPEFSSGQQFSQVFPTTMRVITPAIPFQKDNSLEIIQNLRDIEIYLNGEFLHSTLLEYVPFLFPGKGKALPYNAPSYMHINKISFEKI